MFKFALALVTSPKLVHKVNEPRGSSRQVLLGANLDPAPSSDSQIFITTLAMDTFSDNKQKDIELVHQEDVHHELPLKGNTLVPLPVIEGNIQLIDENGATRLVPVPRQATVRSCKAREKLAYLLVARSS